MGAIIHLALSVSARSNLFRQSSGNRDTCISIGSHAPPGSAEPQEIDTARDIPTTSLALDLDDLAYADLSHVERAALMSSLGQLEILDQASRALLQTMRVLAGLEPSRGVRVSWHMRDLQSQLETLEKGGDRNPIGDRMLADIYTLLGSVRGLIEALAKAEDVFSQINWRQWTTVRF